VGPSTRYKGYGRRTAMSCGWRLQWVILPPVAARPGQRYLLFVLRGHRHPARSSLAPVASCVTRLGIAPVSPRDALRLTLECARHLHFVASDDDPGLSCAVLPKDRFAGSRRRRSDPAAGLEGSGSAWLGLMPRSEYEGARQGPVYRFCIANARSTLVNARFTQSIVVVISGRSRRQVPGVPAVHRPGER